MSVQDIIQQSSSSTSMVSGASKQQLAESTRASLQQIKEQMIQDPGYTPTLQEKTIIDAIEKTNQKLDGMQTELQMSIHEKTRDVMIKVVDKSTKEVIREIPSEKIVDMVVAMCEQAGVFIDEQV